MSLARLVPFLTLTSCLQIGTGNGSDAGTGTTPVATPAATDAGSDAPVGTGCAYDSIAGITLCTSIAECPGLAVDHDVYPDCGFRVGTNSIDLECVCDNFLCPVGSALTCAQAKDLLDSQSEPGVCAAVADGRCASRSVKPAATKTSTCDKSCASECGGVPGCLVLCGC